MIEKFTAAEVRRRFPNPVPVGKRTLTTLRRAAASEGPTPPCYCVGGAFAICAADDVPAAIDEATLRGARTDRGVKFDTCEYLFPTEFFLADVNSRLLVEVPSLRVSWPEPDALWPIVDAYETAIKGANDNPQWADDLLELAWQLLDDALTYDPVVFDRPRVARLTAGMYLHYLVDSPPADASDVKPWYYHWRCHHKALVGYEPELRAWVESKGLAWSPLPTFTS